MDIFTDCFYQDTQIFMFGKIDIEKRIIELNARNIPEHKNFSDSILLQRKTDAVVYDLNGKSYTIYGCKFIRTQLSFAGVPITTVYGEFDRLICEKKPSSLYDSAFMRFYGIENLFPLDNIITSHDEQNRIILSIPKSVEQTYQINDNLKCTIKSLYDGITESISLVDINISQEKAIEIISTKPLTVNDFISVLNKIKQYIELLIDQEIQITEVHLSNQKLGYFYNPIIVDNFLCPKTIIKPVSKNTYTETIDDFFSGLQGWFANYDYYYEMLKIWEKTIYNTNVSADDLFLWRCQAFELMCTLNTEIYEKAKQQVADKQSSPNIKNFLSATNTLYKITNINSEYFQAVKLVRDKLTHNNPKKIVTETQKENSYNLIQFYFNRTIAKIMDIEGIPCSLILK